MIDPLEILRRPPEAIEPDPAFRAALRRRLEEAVYLDLGLPAEASPAGAPAAVAAVVPFLIVADARAALDWYEEVFDAERSGDAVVRPDGRIDQAGFVLAGAPMMLADESPGEGLLGPAARGGASQSLQIRVADAVATLERAVEAGARLVRPVEVAGQGTAGVAIDPFGHRWMVLADQPAAVADPAAAGPDPMAAGPGPEHGTIAYVTLAAPEADPIRAFYGPLLGWRFTPGRVEQGWAVEGPNLEVGLWGLQPRAEVQLCYQVDDLVAALRLVEELGGTAEPPDRRPYGLMASCVDNQGVGFQLFQPI